MTTTTSPELETPRRPRWPALLGAALVVAAFTVLALTYGGGSKPPQPPVESSTFVLSGTLTLTDSDGVGYADGFANATTGSYCYGRSGYDDIGMGTQVTVRAAGQVLALGRLDPGETVGSYSCEFRFTIVNVPAGRGIYSVEVAHRGEVHFTADRAEQGVALKLG